MSTHRPEFEAALKAFARICETIAVEGHSRPILVGGAAAEFYSASAIMTGDFDVVTPWQDSFEKALGNHGFKRPAGMGHVEGGWIHPDLRIGFEVVGRSLMDGQADPKRVRLFDFDEDGRFSVIALEDLIADRMGQYASGSAREALQQARTLYALSDNLELDYMERRIRNETVNEYGVSEPTKRNQN